jgi:hypothetical protein
MQIQVNTDDHVTAREALVARVEGDVTAGLARFAEYVTRVEVHIGDENAGKSGSADKRCMMEARPSGRPPVSVTHHAGTIDEACSGAIRKLRSLLDSKIGQLQDHKGAPSIRDAEP